MEILISCEPVQRSHGGGDALVSVTAGVNLGGRQTLGIKVTEESEDIILKKASAAQDCHVQCC